MNYKGKSLALTLIVLFAASPLILMGSMPFGLAQSGTNVSGIITSDTTWTQANSPYTLTGPVAVNVGTTLTIQAGTTVNLGSYYIQVNGTLVAIGNAANEIIFNSGTNFGTINFEQSGSSWNQQTQTGCIIDYAVLSCSINIYNVSPLISNNQFSYPMDLFTFAGGPGVSVYGGSPLILNNTSDSYFDVFDVGLAVISNNTLSGEYAGVGCFSNSSVVIDNTFSGCGIEMGGAATMGATIEGNLLYQGNVAIYCGPGQAIIQNNTIADNQIGIQLPSASSTIIYNNLLNNQLSISLIDTGTNTLQPNDINATYNYWGTTDQQAINQTIFDFKDNFNLGTVNFVPFLTAPNPQAPSLNTVIATPTPTPSSTPTPTQSSTPTTSLTLSPTPTPTQPPNSTSKPFTISLSFPLAATVITVIIIALIVVAIAAFTIGKRAGKNTSQSKSYLAWQLFLCFFPCSRLL